MYYTGADNAILPCAGLQWAPAKIEKLSLFFNEKINLRLGLRQGKGEGKVRVKLSRMIVLLFSIELVGKANFPVITHLNTSRQGWQTI